MTQQYVIDTSVLIQVFIEDVDTARAKFLVKLGRTSDTVLHISEFGRLECVNVLWKRVRFSGKPISEARRAVKSGDSARRGSMILTATSRPIDACSARYTVAMPPRPSRTKFVPETSESASWKTPTRARCFRPNLPEPPLCRVRRAPSPRDSVLNAPASRDRMRPGCAPRAAPH